MPPQTSSTTNVVYADQIAAVTEMAAKRSPIGNAIAFLTQTAAPSESMRCHADSTALGPRRCTGCGGGGAAAGPVVEHASTSSDQPGGGGPSPSHAWSIGACRVSPMI